MGNGPVAAAGVASDPREQPQALAAHDLVQRHLVAAVRQRVLGHVEREVLDAVALEVEAAPDDDDRAVDRQREIALGAAAPAAQVAGDLRRDDAARRGAPRGRRRRARPGARTALAATTCSSPTGRPISSRCGPMPVNMLCSPLPSWRSRRRTTAARRAFQRLAEIADRLGELAVGQADRPPRASPRGCSPAGRRPGRAAAARARPRASASRRACSPAPRSRAPGAAPAP